MRSVCVPPDTVVTMPDAPATLEALIAASGSDLDARRRALEAMPHPTAVEILGELHRAWIVDDQAHVLVGRAAPSEPSDIEADRVLGRWVEALPESLTEWMEIEHWPKSPVRDVMRWCWCSGWLLSSQDEDLIPASDGTVEPLLEEAGRGAPKAAYVRSIVAHHIRDAVHHVLWSDGQTLDARLERSAAWASAARRTGAVELAAYCERLGRYRGAGPVDSKADVEQAVFDLRRCAAAAETPPTVSRDGDVWVATILRADRWPAELCVDASTGRVWGRPVEGG